MKEKFDDILDGAISLLAAPEELENFLQRHSETRRELLPLLETAQMFSERSALSLSVESKERLRRVLLSRIGIKAQRHMRPLALSWIKKIGLSFAALLLLGTSVAAAASRSLPESPLYPLKRATERFRVAIARSAETKTRLRLLYAERRLQESKAVVHQPKALHQAISEMDQETAAALDTISLLSEEKNEELMVELLALTEKEQEALEDVADSVPPATREVISRAVHTSQLGHQHAVDALVRNKPPTSPEKESPSFSPKRHSPQAPTISVETKESPEPKGKEVRPKEDGE